MLEAVTPSATPEPSIPGTAAQLKKAWDALLDVLAEYEISAKDPIVQHINDALARWEVSPCYPGTAVEGCNKQKLEQSIQEFMGLKPLAQQLVAKSKKRVLSNPATPTRKLETQEETTVQGSLPWWYWPLRVGAGVAVGFGIYRLARPKRHAAAAALAGWENDFRPVPMSITNREGLTYREWLDAAGKGNLMLDTMPKRDAQFSRAWADGEDPTEWSLSGLGGGGSKHTNDEGLTYKEWLYAAHKSHFGAGANLKKQWRKAWQSGEDPTEWA